MVGYSFITLPDQEKWSGDGAGIKAITGGDAVAIDPKYRDAYSACIPAVILAVNNNPMRFSDRSGGVSRRRVILPFSETIPPDERDPQMLDKIRQELAVIVRHLMQRFAKPEEARKLLQAQQASLGGGAGNQAPRRPAGRLLRLPDATGKSDRAFYRQRQHPAPESEALPVLRVPVVYGVQGTSAPHEPDGIRAGHPADAEGVRDSAA